jgi:hypothetical protein
MHFQARADGAIFQAFCQSQGEPYLPVDPKTIRAFIEDRVKVGKKPATVKCHVATIARVHIAAGLLNPCSKRCDSDLRRCGGKLRLGRSRLTLWVGKRSRDLSRVLAKVFGLIETAPYSVSPTKPDAGSS